MITLESTQERDPSFVRSRTAAKLSLSEQITINIWKCMRVILDSSARFPDATTNPIPASMQG